MILSYRTILILLTMTVSFIIEAKHTDIRQQFLEKKKESRLSENRIRILDKKIANILYLEGIAHYLIRNDKKYTKWIDITEVETAFRRMIAMEGVRYVFKRGLRWRTWRTVGYPDGNKVVCYVCSGRGNCTAHCVGGFWTIEENPPCTYELYSLINEDKLCGANYTNYKDTAGACPSRIRFTDLTAGCDNPIETKWRITRVFNESMKYKNVLCNSRDYCVIHTTYTITPEHVVFRIINASNAIIYSRIMKPGRNNYICIEQCGYYDPLTKSLRNNDPIKLSLISNKKKRENKLFKEIKKNLIASPSTANVLSKSNKIPEQYPEQSNVFETNQTSFALYVYQITTTESYCKQLANAPQDVTDEEKYDDITRES